METPYLLNASCEADNGRTSGHDGMATDEPLPQDIL